MKNTRYLKVYYLHRKNKRFPYIRLTGVWLQKLGFETGQDICVKTKKKQLIITIKEDTKDNK